MAMTLDGHTSERVFLDEREKPETLSVSAALALAKGALEGVTVRLIGEVSEVSAKRGYKAVYFTVKDAAASLPCLMWNNRYEAAGITLTVGALVELTGRFTLYAAKGRMNFDVFSLSLAGEGRLRLQVAELARKLRAEGLMDPSRKRALPEYPEVIGLVTSPRGAAIHDVLRTLRRRFPLARVLVAGVPVEGATASGHIAEGLRAVVEGGAQVVLVVRGGGSFEDLMPFNDEGLARVIASSPVPVVTGIGHEPDTSIADMVSDLRASTPTAAAEAVSPARDHLTAHFQVVRRSLLTTMRLAIQRGRTRLGHFEALPLFKEPTRLFETEARKLDDLSDRLLRVLPDTLQRDVRCLCELRLRLSQLMSRATMEPTQTVQALSRHFLYQGRVLPERFRFLVGTLASRLEDLSPLTILGRGYAIPRVQGTIVKRVSQLTPGASFDLTLSDGHVLATVDNVYPDSQEGMN